MKWQEKFSMEEIPTDEDIINYLGEASILWNDLKGHIAKKSIEYSKCSAQPGWNLKYKKNNKSLCTLYPMEGYFIALVVIGKKEEEEVEAILSAGILSDYLKKLYEKTSYSAMGRWLMIEAKNKDIIEDIKALIEIRVNSK